jgi:hypothetical protein
MWVDNVPDSPFYGRMYVSWNNFALPNGPIFLTFSDDGTTWSPATQVGPTAPFLRNVQLTGGADGTVFLAVMNEGGGGLNPRQNLMIRSDDGGATWMTIPMGAPFPAPGDSTCPSAPYFARISPIWRFMGWGQPAVGSPNPTNAVVHYVFAGGRPGDTGDIYYTQSLDNGLTWSAPIILNMDAPAGTSAQWMPSLSATSSGALLATWHDRRSTAGLNYEIWGRRSPDNGTTWLDDERISNGPIPQPEQPDPDVQPCYAGDYNYATAFGTTHFATWTDGRNQVGGHFQQDVEFAAVPAAMLPTAVPIGPTAVTVPTGTSDEPTATVKVRRGSHRQVGQGR